MSTQQSTFVNGLDVAALQQTVEAVSDDAGKGKVGFEVSTQWRGGTLSESRVTGFDLGGQHIRRSFSILADEPLELLGTNTHANPQELLMSALNACMLVGYVAGASVRGITLSKLEITCQGELDLRGFLGISPDVKPGYDTLHYTVTISGDGTPEQFQEIHDTVIATSPNRYNVANPIKLEGKLVVV
jgi:uncharacterized OsmC-like protein